MLRLECISKRYNNKKVFENVSLEFEKNTTVAIMGNSGVGKTTLLNIIAGIIPYEGRVFNRAEKISYVFQSPHLVPNLTVLQNVEYVLKNIYKNKEERQKRAMEYLSYAEISDLKNKRPNEISSGECQRVQFARAFSYPSELMLLDEPFTALDIALKTRLMNIYADLLEKSRRTVLFVTHDPYEAINLADNILLIKRDGIKRLDVPPRAEKMQWGSGQLAALWNTLYSELSGQ